MLWMVEKLVYFRFEYALRLSQAIYIFTVLRLVVVNNGQLRSAWINEGFALLRGNLPIGESARVFNLVFFIFYEHF